MPRGHNLHSSVVRGSMSAYFCPLFVAAGVVHWIRIMGGHKNLTQRVCQFHTTVISFGSQSVKYRVIRDADANA